ncbi:Hypothetical protein NTJ_12103 [Nesidiocoris tenuis]|uniref:Uncharacterized protein n=1 Tax=Nesidiocoris tenuis TaxID=355587 RepID=A0ABN7B6P9_9HEMI|nr:Hypothetical protein NTJ_12103 [Nesidiocoris tenuis]
MSKSSVYGRLAIKIVNRCRTGAPDRRARRLFSKDPRLGFRLGYWPFEKHRPDLNGPQVSGGKVKWGKADVFIEG